MGMHKESKAEQKESKMGGAKGAVRWGKQILTTRTAPLNDKKAVYCAASDNGGRTWSDLGVIAVDVDSADLGDGCLLVRKKGKKNELWYSCRHNKPNTSEFAIEVYKSQNGGKQWAKHSTVATAAGKNRGLWSSFLLEKNNGEIWCFYDDEDTPQRLGFPRHQWLVARVWNAKAETWGDAQTVSRAFEAKHLSRDGMGSVVEIPDGELICALESVQTTTPHAANIRLVSSFDMGKTWSYQFRERTIVYQPKHGGYSAYSPWLTLLPNGDLLCVFATNEDQTSPDPPGTPAHLLHCDIKMVRSQNRGRNWSEPITLYQETHRAYMPQIIPLSDKSGLCVFLDFEHKEFRGVLVTVA
jgi:hypothetical protein